MLNLWDEAEKLYNQYLQDNSISLIFTKPKATTERSIIKDFNKLDEDSFSFRYSIDTSGQETLKNIDYINLNNFKHQISIVIERIENIIETISHPIYS
jgi:dephospho-CoA kinase